MTKDLGNCGNPQKLERIMKAIKSAQENKCCLEIILDPLADDDKNNYFWFASENIRETSFVEHNSNLLVIRYNRVINSLPWQNITKVRVIW